MRRVKKRTVSKIKQVKREPYKTSCDICGKTTKETTIWSYIGRKSGRVRGACRRHLKKVT